MHNDNFRGKSSSSHSKAVLGEYASNDDKMLVVQGAGFSTSIWVSSGFLTENLRPKTKIEDFCQAERFNSARMSRSARFEPANH